MTDGEDQPPPSSWWADALNPVENLRALADVGQFGRRAAEEVAERVLGSATADGRPGGSQPELDALLRRWRADSLRAADVWVDLIDGAVAMVGALAGRVPGIRSNGAADARDLELGPVSPGEAVNGMFWVHNPTATAVDDVRPHCSPLRSHRGEELGVEVVSFDPAVLDPLPPRSSCGIEVTVMVPAVATPGVYVTFILVSNVPSMHLPLQVTVDAATAG